MDHLVLFGCWRSSSSHRLQIGLRLKQLPFSYRPVNLDQGEQQSDWYRAINPSGEVPALQVNGETWLESLSILEALEERYGPQGQPLLPTDPDARRRCRELCEAINSSLQPLLLPGRLRRPILEEAGPAHRDATAAALQAGIQRFQRQALEQLNRRLAVTPGPYCLGEQPSLADVMVVPQLEAAMRLGIDLNPYRRLSDLHSTCLRLEAFAAAAPERQADGPDAQAAAERAPQRQQLLAHKDPEPALAAYLCQVANTPIPGLEDCRRQTLEHFGVVASKMTALDGCLLLRWLCQSRQPRRVLEIGVFTGSSSLAILDGLAAEAELSAIDCEPRFTALAEACWQRVGRRGQVDLQLGDARALLPQLEPGFELIYVDGDNQHYLTYLDLTLPLLSPGGLLVFDNVLWRGRVTQPAADDSAIALDQLNRRLQADPNLRSTVLSLSDGMALVERLQPAGSAAR
ncbi:MAG: class I SAM-dependent methyltransferase [Vulcanococcus sp.]